MPYSAGYSDRFLADVKKLDKHQRKLVYKRIEKILANPQLGKPLHAPLHDYLSERLEKFRIIYKIVGNTAEFAWLDHRGHVYD
jgi:mRNA-degrading endonuclease RelE of RelBE toxin-antitoxin system